MAAQIFPTKGNLLNTQKSLALAKLGYDLLDKKRNILIRELMLMVERAKAIRGTIGKTYKEAYAALQMANIKRGIIANIAESMPVDDSVTLSYRSVMGCEIPNLTIEEETPRLEYGFLNTDSNVDKAYINFHEVKLMTVKLAEIETGIYRLTSSIRRTQTRANALKNIIIPRYEEALKFISDSLEEKEREDFSRMKVIKANKAEKNRRGM